MVGAHPADETGPQPKPRCADCRVGRASAHILGKRAHVLQAGTDLLPIEVDTRPAEGNHIERAAVGTTAQRLSLPGFSAAVALVSAEAHRRCHNTLVLGRSVPYAPKTARCRARAANRPLRIRG